MFILLVASTGSPSTLASLSGLATAATGRGHQVAIFFNSEGVRLLMASEARDCLRSLVHRKVRLLACRTSARECGIEAAIGFVKGAEMSSLSVLVELMEGCDRAVFL